MGTVVREWGRKGACLSKRNCGEDHARGAPFFSKDLVMNRLALQAVAPGGLLLTCSCTGLVSEADFLETLRRAASPAARTVQVLRIAGASPDHPFMLHAQEGRYLKAVYCPVA